MMPGPPDGIKEGIELLFSIGINSEGVVIRDDCLVALQEHSGDTHEPFVGASPLFHAETLEFLLLGCYCLSNTLVNLCFSREEAAPCPVLTEKKVSKKAEYWEENQDKDPSYRCSGILSLIKNDEQDQYDINDEENLADRKKEHQQ